MADFSLTEVVAATGGRVINQGRELFTGLSTDTRTLKPGELFIALSGPNFNGHRFIGEAVVKGAAGVIISERCREEITGLSVVEVADPLRALQDLARFHRQRFNLPVVAVTGSNGKTTTKDMTASVLARRYQVVKTAANFNNEIGLPLTILKITAATQAAVVEMGMRGLGQIRELAEIARPTIGVVTNVGQTHIELLGSINRIAQAKSEMAAAIPENGLVVLNGDDRLVRSMAEKAKARVIFFGLNSHCQVRAVDINSNEQKITFNCHYPDGEFSVVLPVIGRHNVYNALAAITIGLAMGLTSSEIAAGLTAYTPAGMRLQVEKHGDLVVINDAYNASPLSMQAAVRTLAEVAGGRKVAVLGDMLELGETASAAHQEIGRQLAANGIDLVITLGKMAALIADTARKSGLANTIACQDHESLRRTLIKLLKPGDTVLIKGSRGMNMEKILAVFD